MTCLDRSGAFSDTTASCSSRRRFLKTSSAAAFIGAAAAPLAVAGGVHLAGSDVLRIGLVGCGGRGSGAAAQALRADRNVKLTSLADVFADRLQDSLSNLQKLDDVAAKIDVPAERQFVGFDAYQQVIDDADVVLLATPPHFRPAHLKAAVDAGKHVFAEKPVAVDAPGVRSVLETCRLANEKGLSIVSGLCLRNSYGFQEMMQRLHNGAIGDLVSIQANDLRGPIWVKPRQPEWTDMHWQMRNWYYFTWLSGDFNVEQHVHYLDVCAWLMQEKYPARAVGMGGRQVRTGAEYGNIYDHHSVVYEYDNGVKLFSQCRQQAGCKNDMSCWAYGTLGAAEISERRLVISGKNAWTYEGEKNNVFQTEHDELFASIRKGKPINNGDYMSHSTLMAIQGRMATYTGKEIGWKQALASQQDLSPPRYDWGPLETPAIALPGVTPFV